MRKGKQLSAQRSIIPYSVSSPGLYVFVMAPIAG